MFQRLSRQLGWRRWWWWELRILWRCRIQNRVTLRLRQQDSDSSDENIADTQAAGRHRRVRAKARASRVTREGQYVSEEKADKRGKKAAVLVSAEKEQKLVDFLHDNEILYNSRLKDYKDRSKREAVWDHFCEEKDACQRLFQSQHTLFGMDACQRWFHQRTLFRIVTHIKLVLVEQQLTERQKWTRYNFDFLRDDIVRHLKEKVNSWLQRGQLPKTEQQRAQHPEGRLCTWNCSGILLAQNPLVNEQTCCTWIHIRLILDPVASAHLDTHTPIPRSRGVSVTSSLADSNLQSALVDPGGG